MDIGKSGPMRKKNIDVSQTVSDKQEQSGRPKGRGDSESNLCGRLSKGQIRRKEVRTCSKPKAAALF